MDYGRIEIRGVECGDSYGVWALKHGAHKPERIA